MFEDLATTEERRRRIWRELQALLAKQQVETGPLQKRVDAARIAYSELREQTVAARQKWETAQSELDGLDASFGAQQAALRRELKTTAPAVLPHLASALRSEYHRTLGGSIPREGGADAVVTKARSVLKLLEEVDRLAEGEGDPDLCERRIDEIAAAAGLDLDNLEA